MTQIIRFGRQVFDIESEELQRAIDRAADARSERPVCMCRPADPPEMYVAKVNGRSIIKRMPETAHLHDPTCDSYEVPRAISGIGEAEGKAILHNSKNETVTLRLGFSLWRTGASQTAFQAPAPSDSARASAPRLTLRATIDYLWDAAQLNRWKPLMRGKRNYSVVYKYVTRAVNHTLAKRVSLAETFYMPEPFYADRADEIQARAAASMRRCTYQRTGKQALTLLFCEVKSFGDARQGAVIQIRHAPFARFYLPQSLQQRMLRIFEAELALWNARPEMHLMLLATVAQNAAGMYELSEAALMLVDDGWMPVATLDCSRLFERLAGEGRAFLKGLRFNADKSVRLADALLTDTDLPTAIYLVDGTEPSEQVDRLKDECGAAGLGVRFVRTVDIGSAELPQAKALRRQITRCA